MLAALWNHLINCCPFFIDVSTIIFPVFGTAICLWLLSSMLRFFGSFFSLGCNRYCIVRYLSHSNFIGYLLLLLTLSRTSLPFLTIQWFADSCCLGTFEPFIKFFLLLVFLVLWKLRGCDRWWNSDIIYCIPVLLVIYHLIDHWGCLLLTTQWFTDSWFQPLLGCLIVFVSSPSCNDPFFDVGSFLDLFKFSLLRGLCIVL